MAAKFADQPVFDTLSRGGMMLTTLTRLGTLAAIVTTSAALAAQAPAAGQPAANPNANVVVENPTYLTIPLEIDVNRPAADVWKRIGGYCAIGEWLQIPAGCKILSGTDGEVGAVRSVANEVLVGKSQYSYTYTQTPRNGRPYNLYHGTVEVRPVTDRTSKIVYTLMYDNSMLADDAAKEKDRLGRVATFTRAIQNMKTLAEGGTIAPRPQQ
jgi:hypothetical protein